MIRALILSFAAAGLAACATAPPPYGAAASTTSAGYSERQIESDRYFVTFRAPRGADAGVLEDYALLRAAELTLENGREWFWVDRRSIEAADSYGYGPSFGIGIGGGSWGSHGGGGVGVGVDIPLGGQRGQRAAGATLEIRFGAGAKPDEPNAYDARQISSTVRSRLASTG
jgi:hypothetical protein